MIMARDNDDGDGADASGVDADDDTTADDEFNELAVLLMQLARFAENDPAWLAALDKVGADCVRQLVTVFETVLSRRQSSEVRTAIQKAADRAAAHAEQRGRMATP
jgi:hypothetical protein